MAYWNWDRVAQISSVRFILHQSKLQPREGLHFLILPSSFMEVHQLSEPHSQCRVKVSRVRFKEARTAGTWPSWARRDSSLPLTKVFNCHHFWRSTLSLCSVSIISRNRHFEMTSLPLLVLLPLIEIFSLQVQIVPIVKGSTQVLHFCDAFLVPFCCEKNLIISRNLMAFHP